MSRNIKTSDVLMFKIFLDVRLPLGLTTYRKQGLMAKS